MPRPTGPPVIIPEEGLHFPPAIWQAVFLLLAPFLAGAALAIPVLLALYLGSSLILFICNLINPPAQSPPLLYPKDQSDETN
jgi:hypothetical protein